MDAEVKQIPIKGFENYLIGTDGSVYSVNRQKYRKFSKTKRGYCSVDLYNNKQMKRILVHRLVAMAFIPNPNNFSQINHKDENPSNNSVSNLEWCTAKYNMNYGEGAKTRHLKIDYSKPCYKENAIKNGKLVSKSVLQFDTNGNFICRYESGKEASRQTKINHAHILEVCNGKSNRKTAGKYIWKFERSDDLSLSHV